MPATLTQLQRRDGALPAAGARVAGDARGLAAAFDFMERGGVRTSGLVLPTYGTLGTTVKYVGGPRGAALNFPNDATNGFVTVPSTAALANLYDYFTITVLVRRAATGATQGLFDQGHWELVFHAANFVNITVPGVADHNSTATVADTNWHHIAVTKDGNGTNALRFYIDGVFSNARTPVGTWVADTGNKLIGKESGFAIPHNGDIAFVHLWNRALAQVEIQRDRNAPYTFRHHRRISTPVVPPPTVVSATTNATGTVVTVTFSKAMADPAGKHGQFSLNDGTARTFSAAALNADTTKIDLTITGGGWVAFGATLTLAYTAGTVLAADGGVLATFSGQAVTNAALARPLVQGTVDATAQVGGTVDVTAQISGTVDATATIEGTIGSSQMTPVAANIVEADEVIVRSDAVTFLNTITKDGATYNLTGKTVTVSIRAEDAPETAVDATLEDQAVTLSSATLGIVTFALTGTQTGLLTVPSGAPASYVRWFLAQYRVTPDTFMPQALRFGVRQALN